MKLLRTASRYSGSSAAAVEGHLSSYRGAPARILQGNLVRQFGTCGGARLILGDRSWIARIVDGYISQRCLGDFHIAFLFVESFCVDFYVDGNGCGANPLDSGVKREDISYPDRLLEHEFIDCDRRGAAAGALVCGDGTSDINLRHEPAAEDVSVGIAVRWHGDDFEYQFVVVR